MTDGDQPHPEILVSDRQSVAIDEGGLVDLAARCLTAEGAVDVELSLSFVDVDEMAELHQRYLGEPGPTDVLSFPLDERDGDRLLLGDVVVCPDYAARTASDLAAELRLLVVHGILHLLGHDHEEAEERAVMWELQERYSGVNVPEERVS